MKKFLIIITLIASLNGFAQIKTPPPSPAQTIKQEFGLGSIELSYSRPSAKKRKVMGDLVPFGQVWRTGANLATTIQFSDDVTIGTTNVKAGKYGLLTIPNEKEWTIILTKDLNVTQASAYKQENDVVRYTAPVIKTADFFETFLMEFNNMTSNSCELWILWEKTGVVLPIKTDVDQKVMAQIENAMFKDTRPYFQAAQYYYDAGKDLKQAKEWATKAVENSPNAFWMHLLKARIHAKLGEKAEAKASAQKCVDLATAQQNGDYVKMGKELIASL